MACESLSNEPVSSAHYELRNHTLEEREYPRKLDASMAGSWKLVIVRAVGDGLECGCKEATPRCLPYPSLYTGARFIPYI